MKTIQEIGVAAVAAKRSLARLTTEEKNNILTSAAQSLRSNVQMILDANKKDIINAKENGIKPSLIDRLTLDKGRIEGMADGLEQVAKLPDPIGEVINMKTLPNGLTVGKKRVPMGVIGIIYEARPNVTSDAFGLCLKAGSAVILRGGKEAINSNTTVVNLFRDIISSMGYDSNVCLLYTSRCV